MGDLAAGRGQRVDGERSHRLPLPVRGGRDGRTRAAGEHLSARRCRRDREQGAPPGRHRVRGAAPLRRREPGGVRRAVRLRGRPLALQVGATPPRRAIATSASRCGATRSPTSAWSTSRVSDSTSHLFGHLFRAGELGGELATQQQHYGHAVEEMYVFADELVGQFMNAIDDDTTLVVLSDHGFDLGQLHDDPSKTRDLRRVSERFHNIEGIVYLYGAGGEAALAPRSADHPRRRAHRARAARHRAGGRHAGPRPRRGVQRGAGRLLGWPPTSPAADAARRARASRDTDDRRGAARAPAQPRLPGRTGRRRSQRSPQLAAGRPQPGGDALRVGSLRRGRGALPRPHHARARGRLAPHQPGRRARRSGALRRGRGRARQARSRSRRSTPRRSTTWR